MYAIVRNADGTYYTSTVFGYFCKVTATDDYEQYLESIHKQFYLVLNEKKDCLVKKYVFPKGSKYLDPKILIVDADQRNWVLDEANHGCVDFLHEVDAYSAELKLDSSMLKKCIAIDAAQNYQEIVEVNDDSDIANLLWAAGGFHDAYIKKCERNGDVVHVLLDGIWGCQIELWFEGSPDFCIDSRDPEYDDPAWYGATVLRANGVFYLVDDEDMKVEDITDKYCWFRGNHLKYHVIPDP